MRFETALRAQWSELRSSPDPVWVYPPQKRQVFENAVVAEGDKVQVFENGLVRRRFDGKCLERRGLSVQCVASNPTSANTWHPGIRLAHSSQPGLEWGTRRVHNAQKKQKPHLGQVRLFLLLLYIFRIPSLSRSSANNIEVLWRVSGYKLRVITLEFGPFS